MARADPFHNTCEEAMNPLPITETLKAVDPKPAEEGRIEAIEGAGFAAIVKEIALDVPPPGAGFTTVIAAVPVLARSAAVTAAANCVALTNVVTRLDAFHCTCEEATNPLPLKVSVNAPELLIAEAGRIELSVGAGLAVMMKFAPADDPPPGDGFTTATVAAPAVATSAVVIAAVSCVALT